MRIFLLFMLIYTSNLFGIEKISLQLAWKNQFQFAGYYMAKEKGFYSNVGLDVNIKEFANNMDVTGDVISGKSDFGVGRSSLIYDRYNDKPVVMLGAIFQHSPVILLTKKRDDIVSVEDLKDKKIMLTSDQLAMASINAMLQSRQISSSMYTTQAHTFNVQDLIDGKTDVMLSYISNEPYTMKKQNIEYTVFSPKDYKFDFYSDILFTSEGLLKKSPQVVKNFRAASLIGWEYAIEHKEETVDLILKKYNTQNKTKEALTYEANAIEKLIAKDDVELGNIDSKRIEYITQIYSLMGLIKEHKSIEGLVYKVEESNMNFTSEEQKWLQSHPIVKFTGDPGWLPFEAFTKEGKYIGIVSKYLEKLEKLTGIKFKKVPVSNWIESLSLSKTKQIDVLSDTIESSRDGLIFTKPYITNDIIIVMDKEHNYVDSLETIKHKKIALIKDYGYIKQIKDKFPYINFIEVDNIENGLKAVSTGKIDALACTFALGTYTATKMGLSNIKVVGKTQFTTSLGLGVREDYSIFVNILNKAIDTITQEEHNKIFNHWIKQEYVEKVDYSLLYKVAVGAFIILLLFIVWNRKMAQEIDKRKEIENQLQESSVRMSTFFDASPDSISIIDENGNYVDCNQATLEMFRIVSKEEFLKLKPHNLSPELQYNNIPSSEVAQKEIRTAFDKGINKFEWQHHRVDTGELFDTEIVLSLVILNHKPHIYGIVRDITENKKIQNELRQIQEKQRLIIEKEVQELTLKQTVQLKEIQKFQALTVGREGRMIELKELANDLSLQLNNQILYDIHIDEDKLVDIEEDERELEIDEIIDIPSLQGLLDNFCNSIEIASAIIDLKGNVLASSRWQKACTHFHRVNESSCANCIQSDTDLSSKLEDGEEYSIYKCKNGLVDCASPIIINGKHIANVFIGQFLIQKPNILFFTEQSQRYGYNQASYLEAINEVPIIDEEKLPFILKFLSEFTKIITSLSMEKLKADKSDTTNEKIKLAAINLAEDANLAKLEVEDLSKNLEQKVQSQTKDIREQKEFVTTLMDSQEQIIITTNGEKLISGNKKLFNFYEINNVTDFMDQFGDCICDTFDKNAPIGYLQKNMNHLTWIEYILENETSTHKAQININNKISIFSVTASTLPTKDNLKSAVFTDITAIEKATKEIEDIHKHTRESIEYASLIQGALIPNNSSFNNYFADFFTIWQPKDVVGGDIYLFEELRNKDECLLMVIDCTGHGVPGAFVTMLVKAIERQITSKINYSDEEVSPSKILSIFNHNMKQLLKQENIDSISNAGFDGGIIYYNKKNNILKFAGAETALFYIEDDALKTIKGNRYSVGYKKCDINYEYKEHIIEVKDGMKFYLTTDGYLDQNGGDKSFPFGKRQFSNIIQENNLKSFEIQKDIFIKELDTYQKDEDRNDDITMVAFKV